MKRIVTLLLALALVLSLVACGGKTAETKTEEPTQSAEAEQPAATEEPAQNEQPAETQTAQEPQTPDAADQTGGETVTFTDDCGRTVEIPAAITRVVPTGGMAQVALFALAPEMFVGLASDWSEAAEAYVDPAYRDLPVLGALYGSADLNLEELALTDPQLPTYQDSEFPLLRFFFFRKPLTKNSTTKTIPLIVCSDFTSRFILQSTRNKMN